MAIVQVRLLGATEVVDGSALALSGRTQRRLLALLALHRNDVVSVGQLVEVTWPDRSPKRADHDVRSYVHRLRRSLRGIGDRIETIEAGYRIRLDSNELDIAVFDRLGQEVGDLQIASQFHESLDVIADAEAVWRGRPLGEFAHEPWARAEVARLDEARYMLCQRRASALLECGMASEALVILQRLTDEQPFRENPRALSMRALYSSGRQAEALRSYQDYRTRILAEIGVEPSAELATLDRAIARGEPLSPRDP